MKVYEDGKVPGYEGYAVHIVIAHVSRGYDLHFEKGLPCEYCYYRYIHYQQFPGNCPRQPYEIRYYEEVDHIRGRGGSEKHNYENRMRDPRNLIMLCKPCHAAKRGDKEKRLFENIILPGLKYKTYDLCVSVIEGIEREGGMAGQEIQDASI